MKLKLRIDPDDLLMFGIFSVFLLFVLALLILNLSSLAKTGHLSGLNPFPAFGPDYIGITLPVFLLAEAAILFSVKSYIFEMDKGIGLTTEKVSKGYSRWAKDKEVQNDTDMMEINVYDKKIKGAGIPLIIKKDKLWVDNGEYHTLVIGSTGSGKTQTVVFPTVKVLARHGESMIITDPKGEIYEQTANMLRKRGYQILLLNFRDPQKGNAWNPMSLPYDLYQQGNQDKAIELLDDLALNILYDASSSQQDPFWEKTSADYFAGVALGLFEDAKPEEININSISLATTVGEEKFGGSTYIKEYFGEKDPKSAAAIDASSTIMAPDDTKDSILAVFKQKIKLFASRENLSEMLSYSDVDLSTIGEKKTAVFIVIQDEKKTYHALATILLKQIYETLISTAQKHGGKLPIRTNFILDEFANMPPLKDVTTMITAARSRKIRFTMIIQNFAQLDQVYGKEEAETIRGNCGNLIYLITSELKALEEISKMCGEVKSKKDDKTASTPLVTVSDLQRMKLFDVIVLRSRLQPYKTHFTPDFQLDWGEKYPKSGYPQREKKEIHTFDLKQFVKDTKKKKLLEMMNQSSDESSSSSSSQMKTPMNPFEDRRMSPFEPRQTSPFGVGFEAKNETPNNIPRSIIGNDNTLNVSRFGEFDKKEEKPQVPSTLPIKDTQEDEIEFDVDELVKKIDAKIAELEREEELERQKSKALGGSSSATVETVRRPVVVETPSVTIEKEEPKQTENIVLHDIDEDDDDFFDDFFDN
jgi:type IV secretion system protein VirD4